MHAHAPTTISNDGSHAPQNVVIRYVAMSILVCIYVCYTDIVSPLLSMYICILQLSA